MCEKQWPRRRAKRDRFTIGCIEAISADIKWEKMKVHIPTPLRPYAGKNATIEVRAATVGEALNALIAKHSELKRHLYTDDGKLRAFVNVYLNDEDVRYLQKEATAVQDGDNISIVPSIAGGASDWVIGKFGNCIILNLRELKGSVLV